MTRIIKYILITLLMVSCIEDPLQEANWDADVVEISMTLDVSGENTETKAIVDPEIGIGTNVSDIIKNFWVLQYDGIGDKAKLVGEPQYYHDMSVFLKPIADGGNGGKVKLVKSTNKNKIVVLANTFDPLMTFPKESNLSDLMKRWRSVTDPESFLSSYGEDTYLMFNGSTEVVVTDGVEISCLLKRNVAKVVLKLINLSPNVTINSWQMRDVPSISYFYTDYSLPINYPAIVDFQSIDYPVVKPLEPLSPVTGESSEQSVAEYTVYLPINRRGTDHNVSKQEQKNQYAPSKATYLQVNASYDGGIPIQYTFYLGENLTTDFNINPNRSYSYDFVINAKGNAETDSRVKELGLVDFTQTELANCYIINPAESEGVKRKFRIPVRRVDDFWNSDNYERESSYMLGTSKEWHVSIIATNFDNSKGILEFTKDKGQGKDDYFEFTVDPNSVGNAIVALYTNDDQACWSWHLWITNYSPEEAYLKTPQVGEYSYSVPGGKVHRYESAENGIWHNEYANRFIMDRNLGAWTNGAPDEKTLSGVLYYQFGRKDPFFYSKSYGHDNFMIYPSADIIKDNTDPSATVMFAVNNPLTFISGDWGTWTKDNKYNPSTVDKSIVWMDPNTSPNYSSSPVSKSIFDPCPPGYCVAKNGTWNDFRMQSSANPTTNLNAGAEMIRKFEKFNRGFAYWPYPTSGSSIDVPEQTVFYPAVGVIQPAGNSWYGINTNVYVKSSTIASNTGQYILHANDDSLNPARTDVTHTHGAPVRCVTVRDVN